MSITLDVSTGVGVIDIIASTNVGLSMDVANASSGTFDHRLLSHRDEIDQHPIGAITDLTDALPTTMTNFDILDILN